MNSVQYASKNTQEILSEFGVSPSVGFSYEEVQKRLCKYGYNEVSRDQFGWWPILLRQLKSPFIYLLFIAATLTFFLKNPIDAAMILLFVGINTAFGFYQEYRSEQAARLLRQYLGGHVHVRREEKELTIDSRELVPGDIVIVKAGDLLHADVRFLNESNLMVNESVLSGESEPVKKNSATCLKPTTQIYQAHNIGFSGTIVVEGKGEGLVLATGKNTTMGEVARMAHQTIHISTFEKQIAGLSKFIVRVIFATLGGLLLVNLLIKGESVNFIELLVFAIALVVSVIPEALPVVTTFSLSRGAMRLAKNKVVVKRLSAIEDLGGIEVLCTDKTGTLTENKMAVANIFPKDKKEIYFKSALASETELSSDNPFDLALFSFLSPKERQELAKYKRINDIPFDPIRRRNTVLVQKGNVRQLIVRGAPEEIIKLCSDLTRKEEASLLNWIKNEGVEGHRVISVAFKGVSGKTSSFLDKEENNLTFLGLISFVDPLKKTTKEAIRKAQSLGIKVKIITGDRPEVAGAVAYNMRLTQSPKEVISGQDFDKMSAIQKHEAVDKYAVFARVSPKQKYEIIRLLEEKYEVGFLGEGINDAPALMAANVGLVVQDASDIARESADIILLQKSLKIIIDAIQQGRGVFANTTKYIKATLSSNFGNFYAIAFVSLYVNYLPLLPLQILLLNLLTDFPMIAIATDNIEEGELKRPRLYDIKEIAMIMMVLGLISTIFDFMIFAIFLQEPPAVLQTNWLIGSILTELVFVFSVRTKLLFFKAEKPSFTLLGLSLATVVVGVTLPFTTMGHTIFKLVTPSIFHLILIFSVVILYFLTTEIVKLLYYRQEFGVNNS